MKRGCYDWITIRSRKLGLFPYVFVSFRYAEFYGSFSILVLCTMKTLFVVRTVVIHLISPPPPPPPPFKFGISIAFNFSYNFSRPFFFRVFPTILEPGIGYSWGDFYTQEKLQTKGMANFGGANGVYYGRCANGECNKLLTRGRKNRWGVLVKWVFVI